MRIGRIQGVGSPTAFASDPRHSADAGAAPDRIGTGADNLSPIWSVAHIEETLERLLKRRNYIQELPRHGLYRPAKDRKRRAWIFPHGKYGRACGAFRGAGYSQMSLLPPSFDPTAVSAYPAIMDARAAVRYRYTDLNLMSWDIRSGASSDAGAAVLVLADDDRTLDIRPGWVLRVDIGRTAAESVPWFGGVIESVESATPVHNRHQIRNHRLGLGRPPGAPVRVRVLYAETDAARTYSTIRTTSTTISQIVHDVITDQTNRIASASDAYPIAAHLEPAAPGALVVGPRNPPGGPRRPRRPRRHARHDVRSARGRRL